MKTETKYNIGQLVYFPYYGEGCENICEGRIREITVEIKENNQCDIYYGLQVANYRANKQVGEEDIYDSKEKVAEKWLHRQGIGVEGKLVLIS